jgi:hypothetical protein
LIGSNSSDLKASLKGVFGLGNLTHDTDFASALTNYGIGDWQGLNWDPDVTDNTTGFYCGNITTETLLYPGTESLTSTVKALTAESGHPANDTLTTQLLNWIGFVNTTMVVPCASGSETQDQCYSSLNTTYYQQTDLGEQTWRSWAYQYCTE